MLFSPSCREFNSLQKRFTALIGPILFSENKIIRSAEKLTVKFYLAPGGRNRKFYLAPGMRNGKIYLAPNDSYDKFYLAVKGLCATKLWRLTVVKLISFICLFVISLRRISNVKLNYDICLYVSKLWT